MVKLPFLKPKDGASALRCIQSAAAAVGISDYRMSVALTHFLEGVVAETCRGEVVRLAGFGIFGTHVYHPRGGADLVPRCMPSFMGSRAFRNDVKTRCPVEKNTDRELENYRKTHNVNGGARSASSSVAKALAKHREITMAQMVRKGIKWSPRE